MSPIFMDVWGSPGVDWSQNEAYRPSDPDNNKPPINPGKNSSPGLLGSMAPLTPGKTSS